MKHVVIFLLICLFVPCVAQRARVVIDTVLISLDEMGKTLDVQQFDDGTETPAGYDLIGRGHYRTGPGTIKCGERLMRKQTRETAKNMGANGYRFYEVKEPNGVFNTCYKAKILFFRRK